MTFPELIFMLLAVFCWPITFAGFMVGTVEKPGGGSRTCWLFRVGVAMVIAAPAVAAIGAIVAPYPHSTNATLLAGKSQ